MKTQAYFEARHAAIKNNRWFRYFTVFNRVALAAGFLPSGYVKIMGERFTDLHNNQPMGHYLEALYHTGYYYTVIGIVQVLAALLLLIPRTALLGVLIYFPVILNICILSFSVRFEGSLLSSPLMVLSCIYLMAWDYDRLKYILPVMTARRDTEKQTRPVSNRFPVGFAAGSFAAVVIIVAIILNAFNIMPRNTLKDCQGQCDERRDPEACKRFCECIHLQGEPLRKCLTEYKKAANAK
ncbi:DoxX family protein [Pedobacter sp. SYP-B3415]|uniref:DoxX family protein n=1 Tax=Pedobacter sp. SYP-B3415 TaxID=2496641 RepID=UPI00101D8FA4|nr:DoxX family protein [Pedobacter sp. SYP-B3415]